MTFINLKKITEELFFGISFVLTHFSLFLEALKLSSKFEKSILIVSKNFLEGKVLVFGPFFCFQPRIFPLEELEQLFLLCFKKCEN